jgi:poly(3-hydroxybutyrate) depolymerase
MIKNLIFILFFSYSISVNAFVVQGYDVSKAWEGSQVYVPSNFLVKTVNNVKVDSPFPVVILLHGCGGIGEHEKKWAQNLKSEGFIVVLPDSFAIPNRVINCIPSSNTPNIGKVPINDLRPAEAEFAMKMMQDQVWADKRNIFLMGHSEGGAGAFLTKEVGFKGIVVSGFSCGVRKKVGSADTTSFIAINWEIDPYFSKDDTPQRQCSDRPFWKNRADKVEIILKGKGHATAFDNFANREVIKFLKARVQN